MAKDGLKSGMVLAGQAVVRRCNQNILDGLDSEVLYAFWDDVQILVSTYFNVALMARKLYRFEDYEQVIEFERMEEDMKSLQDKAKAWLTAKIPVLTKSKRNPKTGEEVESVKFASAHELRRSFGERWSNRVLPQALMSMMRHENIETTLRFYIGRNAQRTADTIWEAFEKSQEGTVSSTVANLEQQTIDPKTTQALKK